MENDLEKEIKNYFEQEILEPNENELIMLKQKLRTMPNTNEKFILFKKYSFIFLIFVLLIPAITIPIILNNKVHYYSDDNLNKTELTVEFTTDFINTEFYEYSEILTTSTLCYSYGLYSNESLISIICSFEKNDVPFTSLTLQIDLTSNYVNNNKELYKLDSIKTQTEEYVLYEKTLNEDYSITYLKLLDHGNYIIYLSTNIDDSEIFEIFL